MLENISGLEGVVRNTGCDVIVDDEEDAAMVVEVEIKKEMAYIIIYSASEHSLARSAAGGIPWLLC